jgi:hypothetical protein
MNWFFEMPIEFQIGSIIAVVFLAFSMLLSLLGRGFLMHITLLISFLSCFACWNSLGWFCLLTVIVYGFVWVILIKQYIRALAREQLKKDWKFYSSDYECVSVDPLEFTWLDLDYYDTTQRELESLGFQKNGDFELLPQTRAFPHMRTFSRKFINTEQNIGAIIAHSRIVKPQNESERLFDFRIVKFSSEFSDDTFLETDNARGVSPILEIGGIEMLMFEPTIPFEELLDIHKKKIESICETKKVNVVIYRNAQEMSAASKRRFLLFCKDRREKGEFTESEKDRIISYSNLKNNDAGVKIYFSEYHKQARKRRKKQEDEFSQS